MVPFGVMILGKKKQTYCTEGGCMVNIFVFSKNTFAEPVCQTYPIFSIHPYPAFYYGQITFEDLFLKICIIFPITYIFSKTNIQTLLDHHKKQDRDVLKDIGSV